MKSRCMRIIASFASSLAAVAIFAFSGPVACAVDQETKLANTGSSIVPLAVAAVILLVVAVGFLIYKHIRRK